ncbi:hypothetical protein TUN199_05435 [Pyrenophora tritici-repentis]|nr:hypothetical protein PtrV1_03135 [Pyrenophora tritici-repentis]KAI0578869.1 hypothetical protein Alg215_06120 [Pyrenophora tritici-repentis]KAI0584183.1 hypothetical protein Alg130_05289 [Pyrenophora tritici-repentis]KAI0604852.1 hypothetical protein TUN205_10901 [Pyrenophora tritici-repentis]KAI0622547.1 hypothetical protein TUN199_05435 [Pyrenophora tritici-repentis]
MAHTTLRPLLFAFLIQDAVAATITSMATTTPAPVVKRAVTTIGYVSVGELAGTTQSQQQPQTQQQTPPAPVQYYQEQKPAPQQQVQQIPPPQQQHTHYDPNAPQAPQFYDPNAHTSYAATPQQGGYAVPPPEKTPAATSPVQMNPYYADNGPVSPVPQYSPAASPPPVPANVNELPTGRM